MFDSVRGRGAAVGFGGLSVGEVEWSPSGHCRLQETIRYRVRFQKRKVGRTAVATFGLVNSNGHDFDVGEPADLQAVFWGFDGIHPGDQRYRQALHKKNGQAIFNRLPGEFAGFCRLLLASRTDCARDQYPLRSIDLRRRDL